MPRGQDSGPRNRRPRPGIVAEFQGLGWKMTSWSLGFVQCKTLQITPHHLFTGIGDHRVKGTGELPRVGIGEMSLSPLVYFVLRSFPFHGALVPCSGPQPPPL